MKHFQSLDCIVLSHSDSSFLRVDTSIDCQSTRYLSFRAAVFLFIIIYQSIPIVWFILLFKQREELHQKHRTDINLALFVRDQNKSLNWLRLLFNDYVPSRWWFEVVEIYRRMMFVGVLPLMSPDVSIRSVMGVIFSIISVAFYREEQPFRIPFTNFIAFIAQYVILLVYYCALSISTELVVFGLSGAFMGVFLVALVLLVLALVLILAFNRIQRERDLKKSIVEHATRRAEDASNFSHTKFVTTFKAIFNTAVPATHVLAFHYSTLQAAQRYQKCGIMSKAGRDGIFVSLRGPHQLTASEFEVFASSASSSTSFEAVIVVALPARVLTPVPGVSDQNIRMVASGILLSLRPTSFTAVFDAAPWLKLSHMFPNAVKGPCILPPASIVRVYVLTKESTATIEDDIDDEFHLSEKRSSLGANYEMTQLKVRKAMSFEEERKTRPVGVDLVPTKNINNQFPLHSFFQIFYIYLYTYTIVRS
mmetsp:Transcript_49770/g.63766  ORF Transcript_49770/g.63766 Transcript_49770/m.63766 type:complete len:478 (-) Transcript_49770:1435-2868(-)